MLGKEIESFFCEPPVTGQYVNLNQESTDKHLAISGIAVYSESAREFKRATNLSTPSVAKPVRQFNHAIEMFNQYSFL